MKNKFLVAVIASMLYACGGNNNYIINGTMPDSKSDSTMVYLIDYNSNSIVDSCSIADAKFNFEGILSDSMPVIRLETTGNYRYYANVIMEPGVVNVDMNRKSKVYGGIFNDTYSSYSSSIDSVSAVFSKKITDRSVDTDLDALRADHAAATDKIVTKFIYGNEKNSLGVLIAWDVINKLGASKQKIDSMVSKGGESLNNFKPIRTLREFAANKEITAVGKMFVDFDAMNSDDSPAKLSDYVGKGNYVLVDFWASWCGPCKAELPTLRAVYSAYKDSGLVVLGMNVWDSKEPFQASLATEDMPWSHIYQISQTPTNLYGINGIPHIILFAPDGTIAARGLRGEGMKADLANIFTSK